jgi:hypothetical protein
MGRWGTKENDREMNLTKIHYENFHKCHNVPQNNNIIKILLINQTLKTV